MFQIESIDHAALIVQDMERAMKWYQDILGMERRDLEEHGIPFRFRDHIICHSLYIFDPDRNQIEITTFELT